MSLISHSEGFSHPGSPTTDSSVTEPVFGLDTSLQMYVDVVNVDPAGISLSLAISLAPVSKSAGRVSEQRLE